ncbi:MULTISPECIES: sulfur carrier protein ThiS [unclassified Wenzhouxiangella]|uniref:sulfur carrier protein ThiS n=1 Tax=unclassified Wenzhouxiangella TaxID=2613841 RepID=UPI000E325733|nr:MULTISPECIES: sulfur carrier protein ThiS [unclassified Wenzhouxiangella]RFF27121.1 sulfur carrier protein ThiS [Wenzhouxiangella sp. 15181]RFP69193.1 sulfur carrier protein ThiS [Wenzhouxiangella sp. 15190]
MEVRLNGETQTFSDNLTVAGVLEELGYDEHGVRVVRNGERVPESQFAEVTINHGDRVEIAEDGGGG